MKNNTFYGDLAFVVVLGCLVLIFALGVSLNHVRDNGYKTEKMIAVVCGYYGNQDPQLDLLCARNGF